MSRIVLLAGAIVLAACQNSADAAPPGPRNVGYVPLDIGRLDITIAGLVMSDGVGFSFRHIDEEPTVFRPGSTGTAPGLRISGTDDAEGIRAANRAMGLICGIDPDEAEDYGAYGDPVLYDEMTGEWVYWLDCRAH